MKTFQVDFRNRCVDIDNYLNMLKFMDGLAVHKHIILQGESYYGNTISYQVERDEQKILRANFYLLLYNVVESTTSSMIIGIIDSINDSHVKFLQLSNQYRTVYMDGLFDKISNVNKLREIRSSLIKDIDENKDIVVKDFQINISGNVDYDYLTKIISKFGFGGKISVDISRLKCALKRTKDNRNHLAHGNISFSDCGSQILIQTIEEDYLLIKQFLSEVLANLSLFIDNKKFMKAK